MTTHSQPLAAYLESINPDRAARILVAVTKSHQEIASVPWDDSVRQGAMDFLNQTPSGSPTEVGQTARQALLLLAMEPEFADEIKELAGGQQTFRISGDPVTSAMLVAAVIAVLQIHVKFIRDKDGKWSLQIKKTGASDGLISPLVRGLLAAIVRGEPPPS